MISSSGLWLPKAPRTIPGLVQGLRRHVLNKCEMNSGKSYFNYYGVPRNMWINIPSTQRAVLRKMVKIDTFLQPMHINGAEETAGVLPLVRGVLCGCHTTACRVRQTWAGAPSLPLASSVSLCKSLDFSGFQFPLLGLVVYNKDLVTLQHLEGLEGQYMT